MIYILNSKITDARPKTQKENSSYPENNRLDVFKYLLASLECVTPLFTKVILYIEISDEFQDRKTELEEYIKKLFPAEILDLNWYRNNYQSEWLEVCKKLRDCNDDIIWYSSSEDHIFIDSSLEVLKTGIDHLTNDDEAFATMAFSHFPEALLGAAYHNGTLTNDGFFAKIKWCNVDGVYIMKKERFLYYWEEVCPPNIVCFMCDILLHLNPTVGREKLTSNVYMPTRELCRHFDGYNHAGNYNNIFPPLFIPPGFFEKNMKIKYGYETRDNLYTNLNPSSETLYAFSELGTDYRWCIEDIPLFWKDKITEILKANTNETFMKEKRNFYYMEALNKSYHRVLSNAENLSVPNTWFTKNLL